MKDHYQVKFQRLGGKDFHYGVVEQYSDEAKKAAKSGMCIVNDAVLPVDYLVPEKILIDLPLKLHGDREYDQYVQKAQEEAWKANDALKTFGVNALFSIGVADGSASYVVTQIKGSRCKVEWRGFCMDRYYDHHFCGGGWFPVAEVKRYWRPSSERLFGRSKSW